MKSLEFIFQETEIHFLVNPQDKNVMINATEMAKVFGKDVRDFTRLSSTKNYIDVLLDDLNSQNNDAHVHHYNRKDVINSSKKRGTYMHRFLALKFALWLDLNFELWVIKTIDKIIFGNYKKHWEAHAMQQHAKFEMEALKKQMFTNPTVETNRAYFEAESRKDKAKSLKLSAIRNQYKMFDTE